MRILPGQTVSLPEGACQTCQTPKRPANEARSRYAPVTYPPVKGGRMWTRFHWQACNMVGFQICVHAIIWVNYNHLTVLPHWNHC